MFVELLNVWFCIKVTFGFFWACLQLHFSFGLGPGLGLTLSAHLQVCYDYDLSLYINRMVYMSVAQPKAKCVFPKFSEYFLVCSAFSPSCIMVSKYKILDNLGITRYLCDIGIALKIYVIKRSS